MKTKGEQAVYRSLSRGSLTLLTLSHSLPACSLSLTLLLSLLSSLGFYMCVCVYLCELALSRSSKIKTKRKTCNGSRYKRERERGSKKRECEEDEKIAPLDVLRADDAQLMRRRLLHTQIDGSVENGQHSGTKQ